MITRKGNEILCCVCGRTDTASPGNSGREGGTEIKIRNQDTSSARSGLAGERRMICFGQYGDVGRDAIGKGEQGRVKKGNRYAQWLVSNENGMRKGRN